MLAPGIEPGSSPPQGDILTTVLYQQNRACRELNPGLLSDSQVFSPTILQAPKKMISVGIEPTIFCV